MEKNNYYSQENHGPYQLFNLGDFKLEDGGIISNCQLAYSTFGKLNAKKDNAILITTWYSGTSKIMEKVYLGEGKSDLIRLNILLLLSTRLEMDCRLLHTTHPILYAGPNFHA